MIWWYGRQNFTQNAFCEEFSSELTINHPGYQRFFLLPYTRQICSLNCDTWSECT